MCTIDAFDFSYFLFSCAEQNQLFYFSGLFLIVLFHLTELRYLDSTDKVSFLFWQFMRRVFLCFTLKVKMFSLDSLPSRWLPTLQGLSLNILKVFSLDSLPSRWLSILMFNIFSLDSVAWRGLCTLLSKLFWWLNFVTPNNRWGLCASNKYLFFGLCTRWLNFQNELYYHEKWMWQKPRLKKSNPGWVQYALWEQCYFLILIKHKWPYHGIWSDQKK